MNDALSHLPQDWRDRLSERGQPSYRAGQIFAGLYKGSAFEEMSSLPKALRQDLAQAFGDPFPKVQARQRARDGTEKFLWRFSDGSTAESVAMRYRYGASACLSTQVGCRMGCAFCQTACDGLVRNLTGGEMAGQLLAMGRAIGRPFGHIVLMGMGEPLDNLDNVLRFFALIRHPEGLRFSLRRLSLSTCGLEPGLLKLAELALPVTLSVSLHAPDDATRSLLVPANRALPVAKLIGLCRMYQDKTGRRVTYEYVMIDDVTDKLEQAEQLTALLHPGDHINLIPLNPVSGAAFMPSSPKRVGAFANRLKQGGLNATVRRRLGAEINAACGQLRMRQAAGQNGE